MTGDGSRSKRPNRSQRKPRKSLGVNWRGDLTIPAGLLDDLSCMTGEDKDKVEDVGKGPAAYTGWTEIDR